MHGPPAPMVFYRDILTKKAFENAMTLTNVLGGSTNAVRIDFD